MPSLSSYYHAARRRSDTWERLRELRVRLKRTPDDAALWKQAADCIALIEPIEVYFSFPGIGGVRALAQAVVARNEDDFVRRLDRLSADRAVPAPMSAETSQSGATPPPVRKRRPEFDVLLVDDSGRDEGRAIKQHRMSTDPVTYHVVQVPTFEDALIAVLLNPDIQSCIVQQSFGLHSANRLEVVEPYLASVSPAHDDPTQWAVHLARAIHDLRPEIDLFCVASSAVESIASDAREHFQRIFFRHEEGLELHQSILAAIEQRRDTPFFLALRDYSHKPTGSFHALPISRGKSIAKSRWIEEMGEFFGANIFMAETSATGGGLDSLLHPSGPLKEAQAMAARAFGSQRTYFVTNGTSTANKIVMQALVQPGDIVLASRDCHKSHHYALVLAGAYPVYMDPFGLPAHSMYGAVSIDTITSTLRRLEHDGLIDRVRMLLLTNCTFDGIAYHPLKVMRAVLAIKPDMVFVWDEAWFAFAAFTPAQRRRTAMWAAAALRQEVDGDASVRVYATQSTHKTLTALRQGSMIHVADQEFERRAKDAFMEAYYCHTSTSPNYPILASLDVGRSQVELEGYGLVQESVELALSLRETINTHPLIGQYFRVLTPEDMLPAEFRPSGFRSYYDAQAGWQRMEDAWANDELVLDPTRLTLDVGRSGLDGHSFKRLLMDEHHIQVNKTSRNSVLLMVHIGINRGAAAHLIEVLMSISRKLDAGRADASLEDAKIFAAAAAGLTGNHPPLPNFSRFHAGFAIGQSAGDLRSAFFLAYKAGSCEFLRMDGTIQAALQAGREVVSACFVTPYPPGFPILVPGQVISTEILAFLKRLDVKEIHGYDPRYGLRVFSEAALEDACRSA
jgi:arginine decarboxylase